MIGLACWLIVGLFGAYLYWWCEWRFTQYLNAKYPSVAEPYYAHLSPRAILLIVLASLSGPIALFVGVIGYFIAMVSIERRYKKISKFWNWFTTPIDTRNAR